MTPPTTWSWEKTDARRPGMGGDIAKLFRHEEPKSPGVFAVDAPPPAATLLAREVIQNSWDAARELQEEDSHAPQFQIEFRFIRLEADAKRGFVEALDLASLATRVRAIDRSKVGLGQEDCLDTLEDDSIPIQVLKISERAASGMHGQWDQNRSHMFKALLSISFTDKHSGAGGSYGYGKAGLINGSRVRSVVAYSSFRERADDPGITRRLLGVTYWGPHDYEGDNHTGIGSLSSGSAGDIVPFENEVADAVAVGLGFDLRDPGVSEDLGTGFLLVDPSVRPVDLVKAIERSWWPALLEGDFVASVVDYDGTTLQPRPMQDPVLHTFIEAWEIAQGRSAPGPDDWESQLTGPAGSDYPTVGKIGLVSDLTGWSYADQAARPDDDGVAHRSLVSLTRSPRMVVEYLEAGQSTPFLRGVFVADPAIDDLLRRTEPKGHDSWRTKPDEPELDPEAAAIAKHVESRIKQTVNNHRNRLTPPVPPPEELNLPYFNEIMRKVMSGMSGGVRQPVHDTRPISIRLDYEPQRSATPGRIEMVGTATYSLSDHFNGELTPVVLKIAYRYIEDDRVGEYASLTITPPDGFRETEPGVFHGELVRDDEARFEFVSEPYDSSWSGRLIVNGEIPERTTERV